MTDFDIECVPGVIFEEMQEFSADNFEGKMKVEVVDEKNCILLTIPDEEEGGENHIVVKVKFFRIDD